MDVFISHNHADIGAALHLKRELGRSGFSVWLDVDEIRDQTLLADRILKALSQARNLVVLWSRASARSAWVQMEWITIFNNTPFAPSGVALGAYVGCDLQGCPAARLRALVEALPRKPQEPPITTYPMLPETAGIMTGREPGATRAEATPIPSQLKDFVFGRVLTPSETAALVAAGIPMK